ncbi:MAG TPA: GDSL-type esterase/lipase family protein, partial [Acidimicrobiales bacterium]|nr:GDSL-type esterase/lipase family protein [Acidimicrobiales bacterium]
MPAARAEPGVEEPPLPLQASFTWSVSRYHDRDGNGFPDPARTPEEAASAAPLTVSLDGCGSTPGPQHIGDYIWNVAGTELSRATCRISWVAPGQGSYPVSLTVEGNDGRRQSVTELVVVRDLLVVSLGDSLGSGQGNPHVPTLRDLFGKQLSPPVWEDTRCHRSEVAGSAQVARHIETSDPSTSVTFVHLACSGAKVEDPKSREMGGLLDGYEGQDDAFKKEPLLPPQLEELERIVGDREIDLLLLSIGINDVDFGGIVVNCITKRKCHEKGERRFVEALDLLSDEGGQGGRYAALDAQLEQRFPELRRDPSRIFVNQYPDPTHVDGRVCPSMIAGTIDAEETAWAATVSPRLNERVRAAAGVHGWTLVDGVRERYLDNGECAEHRLFVQAHESLWNQSNPYGTLHPNGRGHAVLTEQFLLKTPARLAAIASPPRIVV